MNTTWRRTLAGTILLLALAGCAGTTAQRLFQYAGGSDVILPGKALVESELKGRSMVLGRVRLALDTSKSHFILPEEAYVRLLENQLGKAFMRANLAQGTTPAYTVDVAIERMQFVKGTWIIITPSIFRARMNILRPDGSPVLRASVECADMAGASVPIGGIFTPIGTPHGSEAMAHAKLVPAMASLLATISSGLQEGKALDETTLFAEDIPRPTADYVLHHTKLGLAPLTRADTEQITGLTLPEEKH